MRMLFFCLLAALLIPTACSGKRLSDIGSEATASPADAVRVPPGVSVPAAQLTRATIDGLYPARPPADRPCCWIAPVAKLNVPKTADARFADITVFVPEVPYFHAHPQGLTITIADGAPVHECCFAPGTYTLPVPLSDAVRKLRGPVTIGLSTDRSFVPKDQGVNADTRRLGIIVIRVDYRT